MEDLFIGKKKFLTEIYLSYSNFLVPEIIDLNFLIIKNFFWKNFYQIFDY